MGLFQFRRGTAAQWTAANPVLASGEPGRETDTKRRKVGDGTSAWNSLPYEFDNTLAALSYTPLAGQADVHARLTWHTPPLVDGYVTTIDPHKARARNARTPLAVTMPDASTQGVEPGVLYLPGGFTDANGNTWRYLMTVAGYFHNNNALENPSIRVSNDGQTWVAVTGAPDPLVPKPASGNNFDQSIALGPDGKVYITYMSTDTTNDYYWEIHSSDLVTWSAPALLKTNSAGLTTFREQSPAPVWDGTQWHVWATQTIPATPSGIRHYKGATLAAAFAATGSTCTIVNQPASPGVLWEHNIIRVGEMWVGLITLSTGGITDLYFMASPDGDTWTMGGAPVLRSNARNQGGLWDRGMVYRAGLALLTTGRGGTRFGCWYSAADSTGTANWAVGYTEIWVADSEAPRNINRVPSSPGRWYTNPDMTALTSGALVTNNCYLYVAYSGEKGFYLANFDLTPAVAVASSTMRAGVYFANDQSDPYNWAVGTAWGTLVSEAASVFDGNSAAHQVIRPAGSQNIWIPPRTYFGIAGACQGAAINIQQGKINSGGFSPYGATSAAYNATPAACLFASGVSGALPTSFTPAGVGSVDCGVGYQLDTAQPVY